MIGLPSALICKYADTTKALLMVAIVFAYGGCASWLYTTYTQLSWMQRVNESISGGRVSVSQFFWPSQWIFVLLLVVTAANHAILASFCRRRIAHAPGGNTPSANVDVGVI